MTTTAGDSDLLDASAPVSSQANNQPAAESVEERDLASIDEASAEAEGERSGKTSRKEEVPTTRTRSKKVAKKVAHKKVTTKKTPARRVATKKSAPNQGSATDVRRSRRTTLFPAATFEDALELALAIYEFGSGLSVRRLTLFDSLGKSPDSGLTRQLITNSAKYGLTTGSYSAETLELTAEGLQAVAEETSPATKARARFKLAVEGIEIFKNLYETYLQNRLPAQAVLMDKAREFGIPESDLAACIDTFTVNTKFVGVLRPISGAERFIPIDVVINDYLSAETHNRELMPLASRGQSSSLAKQSTEVHEDFDSACFYITPIGDQDSEQRKHSDLFMGSLIEPALAEFGLRLVRADKIGAAGMITSQIIQHIIYSKLVIVDLSFHNPNVFYELALRHAVRKPIVQISRAADRLPFDIAQIRTIVVDTTDIYTLVPQLDSLKAAIAAQIRKTLDEQSDVENPLSIFAPYFWSQMPS